MSDNAFAPPRAKLDVPEGPDVLWEMPFKEVRKIYLASVNVQALGVLYAIGAIGLLATAAFTVAGPPSSTPPPTALMPFLLGMGVVFLAGTVTSYTRPRWGRVLGIILCVLSLFSIPWGTIVGILGLIAYAQGGKLFGSQRLRHKDVAAVYKQRKKDKE